jgi:hypothetical protein
MLTKRLTIDFRKLVGYMSVLAVALLPLTAAAITMDPTEIEYVYDMHNSALLTVSITQADDNPDHYLHHYRLENNGKDDELYLQFITLGDGLNPEPYEPHFMEGKLYNDIVPVAWTDLTPEHVDDRNAPTDWRGYGYDYYMAGSLVYDLDPTGMTDHSGLDPGDFVEFSVRYAGLMLQQSIGIGAELNGTSVSRNSVLVVPEPEPLQVVPEPAALLLIGLGVVVTGLFYRKRKKYEFKLP